MRLLTRYSAYIIAFILYPKYYFIVYCVLIPRLPPPTENECAFISGAPVGGGSRDKMCSQTCQLKICMHSDSSRLSVCIERANALCVKLRLLHLIVTTCSLEEGKLTIQPCGQSVCTSSSPPPPPPPTSLPPPPPPLDSPRLSQSSTCPC